MKAAAWGLWAAILASGCAFAGAQSPADGRYRGVSVNQARPLLKELTLARAYADARLNSLRKGCYPLAPQAVIKRGPKGAKRVAITFDDGPRPIRTRRLLDTLDKLGVPACFFLVGSMVEKHPAEAAEIARRGYDLGGHTYSHATMTKLTPAMALAEYRAGALAIQQAAGQRPLFVRPPGGMVNGAVKDAAEGCPTVLWTCAPKDYQLPGRELLIQRMTDGLQPGAIYLLNDGVEEMIDALPQFVRRARDRGWEFASLRDWAPSPASGPPLGAS